MSPEKSYMKVVNYLLNQIQNGVYVQGDRLPAERKLVEELGVSRTNVREAMVVLEIHGIAEIISGSGVILKKDDFTGIHIGSLADSVLSISEVLETRKVIEPQIAALAAIRITEDELNELENYLMLMKSSQFISDRELRKATSIDADCQFHNCIARACRNAMLSQIQKEIFSTHLNNETRKRMDKLASEPAADGYWIGDHTRIFAAIKNKDPQQAEQAVLNHINNVITALS
ncbi:MULTISPECIES: FadR/GntR family transcriptional regulator [Vibrio]|uniref:HTH-type transcriptional regulator LutR n=1 Tax=Vibrio ruber (strain DSM 16370 / JCM 11486 / BCRC 17186 / CECT 7878 / LMG 23124 / VR1) TaxID=1123498 RepID=A0A1R4LMT3_VIBR1|nr:MULTISPECIES: FadR/GntR family transcriptional regulator [Vibrio]KUI97908.1 hypothetical protein VRK_26090 [Vibrio sp. MEBiC08052]WNJ94304.1 FadR/GntR family transcriptional regulator [Vibrio ruber]SJN57892.1 HTH-type transcriptional regulator LutR [Vibrio ruber DSM 16370]